MLRQFTVYIILTFGALHIAIAARNSQVIFTKATCLILSKKIASFECAVNNTLKDHSMLSLSLVPAADIYPRNTRSRADIINKGKQTTLVDHNVDICAAVSGSFLSTGFRLVLEEVRKTKLAYVGKNCPFKKDMVYFFKDFYFKAEKLAAYTPANIKINFTGIAKEADIPLARIEILAEFKKKSKSG